MNKSLITYYEMASVIDVKIERIDRELSKLLDDLSVPLDIRRREGKALRDKLRFYEALKKEYLDVAVKSVMINIEAEDIMDPSVGLDKILEIVTEEE